MRVGVLPAPAVPAPHIAKFSCFHGTGCALQAPQMAISRIFSSQIALCNANPSMGLSFDARFWLAHHSNAFEEKVADDSGLHTAICEFRKGHNVYLRMRL